MVATGVLPSASYASFRLGENEEYFHCYVSGSKSAIYVYIIR